MDIWIRNYLVTIDDQDKPLIDENPITVSVNNGALCVTIRKTRKSFAKFIFNTSDRVWFKDLNPLNLSRSNLYIRGEEHIKIQAEKNRVRSSEYRKKWWQIKKLDPNDERAKNFFKGHKASNKKYKSKESVKARYREYYWHQNRTHKGRYNTCRKIAKSKNRPFDISLEFYQSQIKAGCYYCSASLEHSVGYSLDRIDNSKGYTESNLLPCCTYCNKLRQDILTVDETKKVVDYLSELRNTKDVWHEAKTRKALRTEKTAIKAK